jgi:hypothetical protein
MCCPFGLRTSLRICCFFLQFYVLLIAILFLASIFSRGVEHGKFVGVHEAANLSSPAALGTFRSLMSYLSVTNFLCFIAFVRRALADTLEWCAEAWVTWPSVDDQAQQSIDGQLRSIGLQKKSSNIDPFFPIFFAGICVWVVLKCFERKDTSTPKEKSLPPSRERSFAPGVSVEG